MLATIIVLIGVMPFFLFWALYAKSRSNSACRRRSRRYAPMQPVRPNRLYQ